MCRPLGDVVQVQQQPDGLAEVLYRDYIDKGPSDENPNGQRLMERTDECDNTEKKIKELFEFLDLKAELGKFAEKVVDDQYAEVFIHAELSFLPDQVLDQKRLAWLNKGNK